MIGQSVTDTSQNAIANLGWEGIRLPKPVFVGDTLYSESIVVAKRKSKSRPNAGIVTVRTRGLNQRGETCISFVRSFLVYRRDAREDKDIFPPPETPIEEEVP